VTIVKPEDEPSLQRKSEPPAERAKKARMGLGGVIALACYAAIAFGLYVFVAIYMVANPK
jgi:hypothetical protein